MSDVRSILGPALEDAADAVSDFRSAKFQNATSVLGRFISVVNEEPLASFLHSVLPAIDFEAWWSRAQSTGGSMVGSKSLHWPSVRAERVAMQLALCRAIAKGSIDLLSFTVDFCYPRGGDLSAHLREFADVVLDPLLRDLSRLTETRALPPVLFEAMGRLPPSGDDKLDTIIREAAQKFRDPAPRARAEAVERLWDAWERLKTLDNSANKRLSAEALLTRAADDAAFLTVLKDEAKVLTDIGNHFHIRHFETNRAAISRVEHYDYLFHRMYALIHLLLFRRKQD